MSLVSEAEAVELAKEFMLVQNCANWYMDSLTYVAKRNLVPAHWLMSFLPEDDEFAGEILMVCVQDSVGGTVEFLEPFGTSDTVNSEHSSVVEGTRSSMLGLIYDEIQGECDEQEEI
ncbi:MAG: hypothetical protein CMJ78_04880 [Planctomycetaceae bacterium]|nr:hypothetical protein [Planctomycetaceae bacterium]